MSHKTFATRGVTGQPQIDPAYACAGQIIEDRADVGGVARDCDPRREQPVLCDPTYCDNLTAITLDLPIIYLGDHDPATAALTLFDDVFFDRFDGHAGLPEPGERALDRLIGTLQL